MKKLSLLATLLVVSSTVYGVNYNRPNNSNENNNNDRYNQSGYNSRNVNNNTNTSFGNPSDQRANQGSRYLAANDDRYANSDQKLTKDIHDKLSSGLFSKGYEQVNIDAKNGNVTLTGNVQTQSDKDKVEKEVRNMSGVRSLNSRIVIVEKDTIQPNQNNMKDSYTTPADQQLNMKIRDKITGWFWDSYPNVSLNTANGIVVLEGSIETPKDQQNLMTELRKIEGVKTVKSNLKVNANQ